MTARIIGALLGLLLATSAQAVQLHFEAWPTPSTEGCSAPCYQMRMFLQFDPTFDAQRNIQAIQMDIRIGQGAVPAELPIFPARNDNAGNGNVHARAVGTGNVGVPWDLSSAVAHSPTEGFDALMVHAAYAAFTVGGLADLVNDPGTNCTDADKCAFVEEALALNRVYLGFINITRSGPTPEFDHSNPHSGPIFGYGHRPEDVPYFEVGVWSIAGIGDALDVLVQYGGDTGFIPFLPEPSPALLLAGALALLLPLRLRS